MTEQIYHAGGEPFGLLNTILKFVIFARLLAGAADELDEDCAFALAFALADTIGGFSNVFPLLTGVFSDSLFPLVNLSVVRDEDDALVIFPVVPYFVLSFPRLSLPWLLP